MSAEIDGQMLQLIPHHAVGPLYALRPTRMLHDGPNKEPELKSKQLNYDFLEVFALFDGLII